MNLPNKLTLSRVIMVPFFVVFLLLAPGHSSFQWIALGIFIVASLTDLLDGKIARKYNLVTNFGKFMDPLADKLLVCSALIGLSSLQIVPAWITIIIIAREFIISGFRLIAAEKGIVIAASMWGKWKTTFQMIMLCAQMIVMDQYFGSGVRLLGYRLDFWNFWNDSRAFWVSGTASYRFGFIMLIIANVTMYIALILTIVSLIDYLIKNKDVLKDVD